MWDLLQEILQQEITTQSQHSSQWSNTMWSLSKCFLIDVKLIYPHEESSWPRALLIHLQPNKNIQSFFSCCWLSVIALYTTGECDREREVLSYMVRGAGGEYRCAVCGHMGNHTTVMNHVEAKHLPKGVYQCPHCDNICGTKNSLNVHIHRNHTGKRMAWK